VPHTVFEVANYYNLLLKNYGEGQGGWIPILFAVFD